jgi:hypothetical protein
MSQISDATSLRRLSQTPPSLATLSRFQFVSLSQVRMTPPPGWAIRHRAWDRGEPLWHRAWDRGEPLRHRAWDRGEPLRRRAGRAWLLWATTARAAQGRAPPTALGQAVAPPLALASAARPSHGAGCPHLHIADHDPSLRVLHGSGTNGRRSEDAASSGAPQPASPLRGAGSWSLPSSCSILPSTRMAGTWLIPLLCSTYLFSLPWSWFS